MGSWYSVDSLCGNFDKTTVRGRIYVLLSGFRRTQRSRCGYVHMLPWYANAKYRMNSSRGGDSDGRNRNNVMPRSPRRTLKCVCRRGAARGRFLLCVSKPMLLAMRPWYIRGASWTQWHSVSGDDNCCGIQPDGHRSSPRTPRHATARLIPGLEQTITNGRPCEVSDALAPKIKLKYNNNKY